MVLTTDPADFTIAKAARALENRTISAVELLEAVLARLQRTEPVVRAYAVVDEAGVRAAAVRADASMARGERLGPLHGIPVAVKDVVAVADLPMEAGSRSLRDFTRDRDASIVARLRKAGAMIVGKTVTHELAYGQNVPPTRNAWDPGRQPGGSSAGSAVATAVGSALAAIGTDSGGSIRHPAALNGVVGLKPTYGRVDTSGVLSLCPSLDHVGPITRSVDDCALMFSMITASERSERAPEARAPRDAELKGIRIGVLSGLLAKVDSEMRSSFDIAMDVLSDLGADLVDVDVPELEVATVTGLVLTLAEASVVHGSRLRKAPDMFEQGTRVMLALGELIPATDYVLAHRSRRVVQNGIRRTFDGLRLDAVASPATPTPAAPFTATRERPMRDLAAPLDLHMWANVVGLPALALPSGYSTEKLPLSLQLACRPYDEAALFRIARAYERSAGWHCHRPPITGVLA